MSPDFRSIEHSAPSTGRKRLKEPRLVPGTNKIGVSASGTGGDDGVR